MFVFHHVKRTPSVPIAKNRLKNVLVSDRVHCAPNITDKLENDLYHTISKYIETDPANIQIEFTRSDIHISYTGEKH